MPLARRLSPAWTASTGFYPAEDYHQDYLIHNPQAPYIVYNDLPKIANLKSSMAGCIARRR